MLLLDEPLGALDLKLRKEMQIELKRIQREVGMTFVFVTHDQEEAMAMSDRIAVMTQGRIEQLAAPRAMYDNPATSFVAGFIGDMNHVDGTLRELSDAGFVLDAGEGVVIRGERVIEPASVGRARGSVYGPSTSPLTPTASGGVSATVVTKMYLGHQIQIVGRLANGAELIVRESRESCDLGLDTVDTGDAIELRWGPRAHCCSESRRAASSRGGGTHGRPSSA